MASKDIWRCIICNTEATDKPPRHCPRCGTPAARWRLVVDRSPAVKSPTPELSEAELATHTVEISKAEAEAVS